MSPYGQADGKPWLGVLDQVPTEFDTFLSEPAFSVNDVTFCIWRKWTDTGWKIGTIDFPNDSDADGSASLLFILDGKPTTYQEWAESYYDKPVPLDCVQQVYRHVVLTDHVIRGLNPAISMSDLANDIAEIGYPGL